MDGGRSGESGNVTERLMQRATGSGRTCFCTTKKCNNFGFPKDDGPTSTSSNKLLMIAALLVVVTLCMYNTELIAGQ